MKSPREWVQIDKMYKDWILGTPIFIDQGKDWQTFFLKNQVVTILEFVSHTVFVATLEFIQIVQKQP